METLDNSTRIKICGLSNTDDVAAAVEAGANYVGFVAFERSARHVPVSEFGPLVASSGPALAVALAVNPSDELIDAMLEAAPIDMIQLHGDETVERVCQLRERSGLPVMKAVGLGSRSDLAALDRYAEAADQLLVDTRAPPGSPVPGGTGIAFDWTLIAERNWTLPWMLAGGLDAGNVATAIRMTGATQVDVSSGVESSPGRKDPARFAEFITAARGL